MRGWSVGLGFGLAWGTLASVKHTLGNQRLWHVLGRFDLNNLAHVDQIAVALIVAA